MLKISYPIDLEVGYYKAKIVSDRLSYTNPFIDREGEKKVIAKIFVQIDGFKPFEAAIWHNETDEFASKMSIGDEVTVHIYINSKNIKRASIQPINR